MSSSKILKRFAVDTGIDVSKLKKGYDLQITGKELRHLRASRMSQGDKIELVDKHGSFATAIIKFINSDTSTLSVVPDNPKKTSVKGFTPTLITLAVGMPKGTRSDWLVEKATEVGMSALIPLETDRTVLKLKDPKMDRWQRLMVQASKQSVTKTPPTLRDRMCLDDLLNNEIDNYDLILWGCMPQDTQFNPVNLLDVKLDKSPANALLLIGPEGDLSIDEKKKLMSKSAIPVILSTNRLRVETAAIVFCSASAMLFQTKQQSSLEHIKLNTDRNPL